MPATPKVTPEKESRPDFESTGAMMKKPKVASEKYIGNDAIREMISILENSQKAIPDQQSTPPGEIQQDPERNMAPDHRENNNSENNKPQHTNQSAYVILQSWNRTSRQIHQQ